MPVNNINHKTITNAGGTVLPLIAGGVRGGKKNANSKKKMRFNLIVLVSLLSPFRAFDPHPTLRHFDTLTLRQAQCIASSVRRKLRAGGSGTRGTITFVF
jgi:hypothetical protein